MKAHPWSAIEHPPQLGNNEVHLWRAHLDVLADTLEIMVRHLDINERTRSASFSNPLLRARFVASHAFLRVLLSAYLAMPASGVRFTIGRFGKPRVVSAQGAIPVEFNMSHAASVAIYAFSLGRAVGVDVELKRRDMNWRDIALRFFPPAETRALTSLPVGQQLDAFFATWCRKEAFLKGRGDGLSQDLSRFAVSVDLNAKPSVEWTDLERTDLSQWILTDVDLGPDFSAAVAVETNQPLTYHYWEVKPLPVSTRRLGAQP